ncbi:S-layer homology domain-containing protein [Bengtsoniella intestinalis]|uniref:S-layer homology domain-containing protein n=1 Tax=Bengtsoniella intestinalis TaxID=3073143 RepID=UPI00391F75BB
MKKFLLASLATLLLCTTMASAVENPFTDVSSDSDLAAPVLWALENGITSGTTTTTFAPDDTCTRGQVVTFLWRAKGEPTPSITTNPFTDVASSSPYYTAILWAVGEGITNGLTETSFGPSTNCTSGQVVTFLYRAMGEPESTYESAYADGAASAYVNAINWADETGLLDGMDFAVSAASPRSDIVTFLYRDTGSPEIEITVPEPMEAIGTYMGTIAEYQSTFDTLFDKDGYRVVAVGENSSTAGIVNAKYGVIDQYGTFIVEPVYDSIVWSYTPAEGIAPGNDVLPDVFHAGYVQVTQDGKYGLVNSQGVEVIPCQYDFVAMPSEGICTLYNQVGTATSGAYSHYVGYWNLSLGREILAPDTYLAMLKNVALSEDDATYTQVGAINPEGYVYCFGDFIDGYAMVITDNSYEEAANSYQMTATPTIHLDYANLIDANGNFALSQSVLVYWSHGDSFETYAQKGQYIQFWEATDYTGYSVTNANGTFSLDCSVVYEAGLTSANGVVLEAQFTDPSFFSQGVKYIKHRTVGSINLDQGYYSVLNDAAPNTINEGETLYFNLSGQAITAVSLPAAETTYTIVVSDGLNGVMPSTARGGVDYKYKQITYGVDGSTWYACQSTDGLWGLVDITTGEEILPCMYDQVGINKAYTNGQENINLFEMGVCYVKLGDKEYLVDSSNTIQADVTGLKLQEAQNGVYYSSSSGWYDSQGRIVLPGYIELKNEPDPMGSYTLYQLDGKVYQVSANYLK